MINTKGDLSDEEVKERAKKYSIENEEKIIEKTIPTDLKPFTNPHAFFMAGAPGAGKTEFVESWITKEGYRDIVRIDPDRVRVQNPYYKPTVGGEKGNAHLIQPAVNKAMEYLREECIANKYPFIMDSTFSNKGVKQLIGRLIGGKWKVSVFFLYQNKSWSWKFTQRREEKEGRNITRENFETGYHGSIDMVKEIKKRHKEVQVSIYYKNPKQNEIKEYWENIDGVEKIEEILQICYDRDKNKYA